MSFFISSFVFKAKDLKIRAGEWDTQTTKERLPYQERIVSRIFSHPDYNQRNLANDVVSVTIRSHLIVVCHSRFYHNTNVISLLYRRSLN